MDSASNPSLISDHSSDCCIDEAIRKQLEGESIEVDMEGVVETTPENSQPASVSLYQDPSSTPLKG